MKNQCLKGWKKFEGFGLRNQWLQLYLDHPTDWSELNILGNRQIQALREWLKTGGIVSKNGVETSLAAEFRERGINGRQSWEKFWVNVTFNFATAKWYVQRIRGHSYTTSQLVVMLSEDCSHLALRTVKDAIQELVGLLEKTPIGNELGQGVVEKLRPRKITRRGLSFPTNDGIMHNLNMLFRERKERKLYINAPFLWPWTVFACDKVEILHRITLFKNKKFFIRDHFLISEELII